MDVISVEIKGKCGCGRPIEATVGLIRGGQAPIPCACGFSLMVTAPKDKATRVGINPLTDEAKVLQVGDDEDDDPASEGTKH